MVSVAFVVFAGCGGGSNTDEADDATPSASTIVVRTTGEPLGAVDASETTCRFDGDRQIQARGIVRNAGDRVYHVTVTVRFVDAHGVRVELASDSVTDLQQGESARWDAAAYSDDAGSVTACELSTQTS
jgi:hypothetical protein